MVMINLLRAVYWYDEALQTALQREGWPVIKRTQSLLFANIALGETRPAQLARNLGMSRQSMSQMLADLVARDILIVTRDPEDRRASKVRFNPKSLPLRSAAAEVMHAVELELAKRIGDDGVKVLADLLARDWGPPPNVAAPKP